MQQQMKMVSCVLVMGSAGLACGLAHGQEMNLSRVSLAEATALEPVSVRVVEGVRMDGTLVLCETRLAGTSAAARGTPAAAVVYDSLWLDDVNGPVCGDLCGGQSPGDRLFLGSSTIAWVDDVEFGSSTVDRFSAFDGFQLPVLIPECASAPAEPLSVLFLLYDSAVTGFDTDGDQVIDSPYARTDANGDGLVDEFLGGAVVEFADADTDGDGVGDSLSRGLWNLVASNLTDTDGDGIPGDISFGDFPAGDRDGDGQPDGAVEVFLIGGEGPDTNGDGFPDSGSIYNSYEPSQMSPEIVFWGTPDADTSGCAAANGIPEGSSTGRLWAQTEAICAAGTSMAGNVWDPASDETDLTGAVSCPDPLTPAMVVFGWGNDTQPLPCADTNGDGEVTPADFNAWILSFNAQLPGCDQNGDGLCTPADFNAWILNYNSGLPCP